MSGYVRRLWNELEKLKGILVKISFMVCMQKI